MAALEVKPSPTIPNYRNQVKKALPAHVFQPEYKNLLWYAFHGGILAGGLYLLTAHFSFWTAPFIAIVMGHAFACLGFLSHDVAHGGSIKNLVLRDLIAGIGFSPFAIGPYLWRRWHNADHHNNTQVEGIDPDHLFTMQDYKHNPVLRWLYRLSPLARNLVIFSSFTFRMTQQTIRMLITYLISPKSTNRERLVLLAQWILPVAGWVALTLFLGTQVLIWGYLIPLMVGNAIAISYIATNHFLNPLADERDVLATSLTVTLPKGLRWLDPLHSYFGAHVAHHLFPQAPSRSARIIEAKVAELYPDRYHSMPMHKALKLLWNTPWIYEDNETFVDPYRDLRTKTLGHGLKHD